VINMDMAGERVAVAVDTVIWDLDGTLYEDRRVYDHYASELARFVPADRRPRYRDDWTGARDGHGFVRPGLGYDEARDRLFRYVGARIVSYIDWDGRWEQENAGEAMQPNGEAGQEDQENRPPIETPIFSPERFNIGDMWGIPDVLAAHYGVGRDERRQAFLATRAYMGTAEGRVPPQPDVHAVLDALRTSGKRLVVMSNSPAETAVQVLDHLDIRHYFASVVPDARKPEGLRQVLTERREGERVLSIGDNFVNDIEPALEAGEYALYIDRYATSMGEDQARCVRVPSIAAAVALLM